MFSFVLRSLLVFGNRQFAVPGRKVSVFSIRKFLRQAWACIADYASIVLSMIEQNGGDFISWTVIRFLIRQSLIFGKCKIPENLLTLPMIFQTVIAGRTACKLAELTRKIQGV